MEDKATENERLARTMGDELGTQVAKHIRKLKQNGTSFEGGYRHYVCVYLRKVGEALNSVGLRHDQKANRAALLAYYDAALPAVDEGGEVQP